MWEIPPEGIWVWVPRQNALAMPKMEPKRSLLCQGSLEWPVVQDASKLRCAGLATVSLRVDVMRGPTFIPWEKKEKVSRMNQTSTLHGRKTNSCLWVNHLTCSTAKGDKYGQTTSDWHLSSKSLLFNYSLSDSFSQQTLQTRNKT